MNSQKAGLLVGLAFTGPCDTWKTGRPVVPEWALSMMVQSYPLNTSVLHMALKGQSIADARTHFAEQALELDIPYIWYVDDDVAPPYFAARQLMSTMKQSADDVMVVGGIYTCRAVPTEPIVYRGDGNGCFWRWKHGDIFECTGIGTGCMLVKTEVFRHLEKPWFKTVDEHIPEAIADMPETMHSQQKVTDDLWFCEKVIGAGYKIMADSNVMCVHWDVAEGKGYRLGADSYPLRKEEPVAVPA